MPLILRGNNFINGFSFAYTLSLSMQIIVICVDIFAIFVQLIGHGDNTLNTRNLEIIHSGFYHINRGGRIYPAVNPIISQILVQLLDFWCYSNAQFIAYLYWACLRVKISRTFIRALTPTLSLGRIAVITIAGYSQIIYLLRCHTGKPICYPRIGY